MTLLAATSIMLRHILALQKTKLHALSLQFQMKIQIIKNKDWL